MSIKLVWSKPQTLKEYNENKLRDKKNVFIEPLTNIKCEKCNGFYRHVDIFTVYTTNPAQQQVICDDCGDRQYINV